MSRALTLTTLVVASLALVVSSWTALALHQSQARDRVITRAG